MYLIISYNEQLYKNYDSVSGTVMLKLSIEDSALMFFTSHITITVSIFHLHNTPNWQIYLA